MSVKLFNGLLAASIKSFNGLVTGALKSINGLGFPPGFKTEWTVAGDEAARTITFPLVETRTEGALSYNCVVDWGDGTIPSVVTSYNDANRIHTYASGGTYNVEITGTMEGWSFNNGGDKLKITDIIDWGDTAVFDGFKYLKEGFYGCTGLASLGNEPIPASGTGCGIDGLLSGFRNCTTITAIPVELFSEHAALTTSAFYLAFGGCTSLTTVLANTFRYNTLAAVGAFRDLFNGCTSLVTIPSGLFDYNTAASASSFRGTFNGCISLTAIPSGLFDNNTLVSASGFYATFRDCTSLTAIVADLFKYNTAVSTNGFREVFYGCTGLTAIVADLFKHNTAVTTYAFRESFRLCTALTTIPTDLFRYNTLVVANTFNSTFAGCASLASIPTDLFRYNTEVTSSAFQATFQDCIALTTVPTDTFRYNTKASGSGFNSTFRGCSALATVPADLFRYNTKVVSNGFYRTFFGCLKLQQNANIFYQAGAQATRFLNINSDFEGCFSRASFTGIQGTAPDLWECDYGEIITLDVAPAADWVADDVITGQTSGATSVVVSKTDATHYRIKALQDTPYTLGEIIGVTGVPAKLADQGAAHPTIAGSPTKTDCWEGAGNDGASLDNYGDIPAEWI